MCCVMPARLAARHARAADRVEQRRLAVIDVAHDRDDRRARERVADVRMLRFLQQRIGIVELRGRRLVPHFLGEDHRRFLVEHLVDRHHLAELHQRLDDLGSLHRHLVREVGDGDRFRNRHVADDRARLHRRAGGDFRTIVVAAVASALRAAPAGGRGAAGDVAAQLERATPRRFFLEHLARRLLRRLVALLAGLRRRTVQRAFGGLGGTAAPSQPSRRRLARPRRPSPLPLPALRPPPSRRLPRPRSASWSCASPALPASSGCLPAGARSAPGPSSPPLRARRFPRPRAPAPPAPSAPLRRRPARRRHRLRHGGRARASCAPRPGSCAPCRWNRRP